MPFSAAHPARGGALGLDPARSAGSRDRPGEAGQPLRPDHDQLRQRRPREPARGRDDHPDRLNRRDPPGPRVGSQRWRLRSSSWPSSARSPAASSASSPIGCRSASRSSRRARAARTAAPRSPPTTTSRSSPTSLLRGRCRHCEAPVPLRYPLIELGLAAAFVGCLLAFEDNGWEIALGCAFCATLAVITLTDLELRIIPTKVLIVSAVIGAGPRRRGRDREPRRARDRRGRPPSPRCSPSRSSAPAGWGWATSGWPA